jgi:hypothetical protein
MRLEYLEYLASKLLFENPSDTHKITQDIGKIRRLIEYFEKHEGEDPNLFLKLDLENLLKTYNLEDELINITKLRL